MANDRMENANEGPKTNKFIEMTALQPEIFLVSLWDTKLMMFGIPIQKLVSCGYRDTANFTP